MRERCDPRELLKLLGAVCDDPAPKPEAIGPSEDAAAAANLIARDVAAVRRIDEINEERRAKGPRIATGIFFYEADQRIKSRLFFSLGSEGRKRFLQSYPHTDLSAITIKYFYDNCVLFKKEKNYIIEHFQIYNAVHVDRECLEAFYLRLTGQAALCGWTIDQEKEVVRKIFIAKMRYKNIQRELCIRPGNTSEETLKSALLQEKGAQTVTSLQNQLGSSSVVGGSSHQGSSSAQNFRIKQEPTFSVQGKKLSDRVIRAQSNSRPKGSNNPKHAKPCYFWGNKFSANHKKCHIEEVREKGPLCKMLQF